MSIHWFASGLCPDPQVNISSYYYEYYKTIILNMFDSDGVHNNYLECIIELIYCMK